MITLDRSEFQRLAKQLSKLKRQSAQDFLKAQGKTLARYLIQATPPFNKHPFGESVYAEQKKIGTASITRDFRKSFVPLTPKTINEITHNVNRHNSKYIKQYMDAGLIGKLNTLLRKLGMPASVSIIRFVTQDLARENVLFTRRPHRIKKKHYVIDHASIKRELSNAIAHLGRAKAGWLAAAKRFGYNGAPQWVKRHSGAYSGEVVDELFDPTLPSLTMINPNKGAPVEEFDVVNLCMKQLQLSNQKQMQAILAKRGREFNSLR